MTGAGTVALYAAGLYLAWLRWGTRSNPPIPYDEFRAGYTWDSVRDMLGGEQDAAYEAGQYMWVTRATVLGRWHELKLDQYDRYLEAYEDFTGSEREAGDVF